MSVNNGRYLPHQYLPVSTSSQTSQSTVRKKMAAVHSTTIPCEPNTANRHIESHIFAEFVPALTTLFMLGLTFL